MTKELRRDIGLDALLDLHGQVFVVDEAGGYWVKFIVHRVPISRERPHGLAYSLTLHESSGGRIVGFDNAHSAHDVSQGRDHRHRGKSVKPYDYKNAAALLEDFWGEVDRVLRERGIVP